MTADELADFMAQVRAECDAALAGPFTRFICTLAASGFRVVAQQVDGEIRIGYVRRDARYCWRDAGDHGTPGREDTLP